MIVTLDTNILYQALKSSAGASYFIMQLIRNNTLQIALSVPLFAEYQDVLSRKESLVDFGLELSDVDAFLRFIAFVGKPFDIYYLFRPNLIDENDNMMIELAVTSQSEYLITSNIKDFKNAELKFKNLSILTPGNFVRRWKKCQRPMY